MYYRGGNEGHYLAALIGSHKEYSVNILTSTPKLFGDSIESVDINNGEITVGQITKASSDPTEIIPKADMILFALPSNAYKKYLDMIFPYTGEGTVLGFIPGTGGVEFLAEKFIMIKHCPVFGTQRVPSGTKLICKGKSVNSLGSRKDLRIASFPSGFSFEICDLMSFLLRIDCIDLPNYLSVTLTPSNPILHTSRLYGLFHDYVPGKEYTKLLSFYKKWDNFSSEILIGCDDELQQACNKMSRYDLSGILSLKEHYEISSMPGKTDIEKMTNKIRQLVYLKDSVPMIEQESGNYIPDFESRYFTEDFPFGLCIVKDFCRLCGVETPYIDSVLGWYDRLFSKDYYRLEKFSGSGLQELPLPHNWNIETIEDLYAYYNHLSM